MLVAVLAILTTSGALGGNVRKAQVQLGSPGTLSDEQAELLVHHRLEALLGLNRVPEAEESPQKQKQAETAQGPVTMQVPEKELKSFVSELSPRCETQFAEILHGKSQLHTFGSANANSEASCTKLNGGICAMDAHVTQAKAASGRSMTSSTQVTGNSCLPRDCMAEKDLQVFAKFMRGKAQDTLPGTDANIELRVDCTKSGGSSTAVGAKPAATATHGDHALPDSGVTPSVRAAPSLSGTPHAPEARHSSAITVAPTTYLIVLAALASSMIAMW